MKKLFIIGLILCALLALGATAITVDRTTIDKTVKPTGGFSEQFRITNNDSSSQSLKIERVGTELNDFNISTSPYSLGSTFTLNVNASVTLTLTGTVPDDITTKETPYTDALKIYSGPTEVGSIDLKIIAESQLELDNVKFVVDGKSKSIGEGDTRNDVTPGSKLEIEGDIKNTFTDDDDITIEDVTVEITIKDLEDEGDDDADGDEDVGDIDADEDENFKIEFDIPEDIEADEYDVIILVEGEDENGAKHSIEWDDVKIKIEKDRHDIWITKASVSPSKISCSRNINVDIELKNQGEDEEDEVVLRIESSALDIDYEDTSIPELEEGAYDEDTEYSNSYPFEISDDVRAGTYQINVRAYYDTDTLSDSETITLTIENCAVETTPTTEQPTVVVTPPTTTTEETEEEPEILTTPVTETTEGTLLQSNTYLFLLMGAIGVAVIVIIIMIVVLFSMKKKI